MLVIQCLALGGLLLCLWTVLRPRWRRLLLAEDIVLVTGCDSGVGLAIVEALLKSTKATVCAGCITQEGLGRLSALGPRVLACMMDVTKDEDVTKTFEAVAASGKTLRGVVNNAGIGCYGICEGLDIEVYKRIMEVNFIGAVRVTKASLPLLRASKGRLISIGSVGGRMPSAFGSAYLPTKAAMANFHDCVRQEMFRFGVRCSLLEIGFIDTGMLQRSALRGQGSCTAEALREESEVSQAYGGSFTKKMAAVEGHVRASEGLNGGSTGVAFAAAAALDALETVCPKSNYLVGIDAKFIGCMGPMIPCWIIDYAQTFLV